ncbi:MAG: hypothetical protein ACI4MS_08280 [Candidatus Coproplasma sp.]
MDAGITIAIISGLFTFAGVIITVWSGNSKTVYRIEQLEKRVQTHNNLIERMYKIEKRVDIHDEKINELQK